MPVRLSIAAGLWCLLLAACGGGTTLDRGPEMGTGTTATADSGTAESTGEPAPLSCEAGCEAVLLARWIHEGEAGDQSVAEVARAEDGSVVVGVRRAAGNLRVVRISAEGELQWVVDPALPCVTCELIDLALTPEGDVLLSVTATQLLGPPSAVLARLSGDGSGLQWVRIFGVSTGSNAVVGAGGLAVLGDDRFVQLRRSGYSEGEIVQLQEVDAEGVTRLQQGLLAQPGSGHAGPLLAAAGPLGDLIVAYPRWDELAEPPDLQAVSSRMVPPDFGVVSQVSLPLVLDDFAIDQQGRRLELARSQGTDTITLLVTSRQASDPERWTTSLPLVSTSSTRAALAVGPDDEVFVVARTTPRAGASSFYVVELAAARWSAEGELRWSTSIPLEMNATDDPVELVIDDEGALVVGTVVRGKLHVGRYEVTCVCE